MKFVYIISLRQNTVGDGPGPGQPVTTASEGQVGTGLHCVFAVDMQLFAMPDRMCGCLYGVHDAFGSGRDGIRLFACRQGRPLTLRQQLFLLQSVLGAVVHCEPGACLQTSQSEIGCCRAHAIRLLARRP